MSRAIRRHHRERLKKARRNYWCYHYLNNPMSEAQLSVATGTPHPCSCLGCGNQRRYDGPTRQERRFMCEPLTRPAVV